MSHVLCVRQRPCIAQSVVFLRSFPVRTFATSKRCVAHQASTLGTVAARRQTRRYSLRFIIATGVASVALGISSLTTFIVTASGRIRAHYIPCLKLISNLDEAIPGFCGLVAGFVVKNTVARLFAYFLRWPFIIIECLDTAKLVKVEWPRMGPLYAKDAIRGRKAPTTRSICKWIADSLPADVQSTRGFVKGFKSALVHAS